MTEQERLLFTQLVKDDLLEMMTLMACGAEEQRTGRPVSRRVTEVRITRREHGLRIEAAFGSEEEPC